MRGTKAGINKQSTTNLNGNNHNNGAVKRTAVTASSGFGAKPNAEKKPGISMLTQSNSNVQQPT